MDDIVQPPPPSTRPTPLSLRRRNTIATSLSLPSLPSRLAVHSSTTTTTASGATSSTTSASSSSTSSGDLEFISIIKPSSSYTSIRDLLPSLAAVPSPTSSSTPVGQSGYEISIRNRLVKQAAWAYLQPMSTSSESVAGSFIHRIWIRISVDLVKTPVAALLRFIVRSFNWMLRAVRVHSYR